MNLRTAAPDLLAELARAADCLAANATHAELAARTFPNAPGQGDFARIARDLRLRETAVRAVIAQTKERTASSDRRRRMVLTADDLPVTAQTSKALDFLARYFQRSFRANGRGYGGTVAPGHWLRVTCRPSELAAALAQMPAELKGGAK